MILDNFSEDDIKLLANADIMFQKRLLIEKVYQRLELLSHELQEKLSTLSGLSPDVKLINPKISKGENYKGLPYLVLDYPRFYEKEDVLAFRVMIWWGKHISTFIHLKGKYLNPLLNGSIKLEGTSLFYAVSKNEWEQENTSRYFQKWNSESLLNLPHPYLKLGRFMAINEIDQLEEFVGQTWEATMTKLYC